MKNQNRSELLLRSTSLWFAKLSLWSYRHRWWVLSFCLAILGGALYLAQTVRMDNSFEAFFDASDPAYSAYNVYRDNFGSDELIYIMYDASEFEEGVFNQKVINKIHALGKAIDEQVPFVDRVRSITNAELMIGQEDDLIIKKIEEELPLNQTQLNDFANAFAKKPLYIGNLFNETQKLGAISVEMNRSSTDPIDKIRLDPEGGNGLENLYPQVSAEELDKILADPEYSDLKFYLSGDVPLNDAYNRIIYDEMTTLGGLSFLVIAIILAIFFRGKIIGVLGPITVVGLALMMTVAFIAAMGWNIDMMFGLTPTLLTAIGVAHAVHIITEFLEQYKQTGDREKAIYETLYLVGTPCLLTSITTAAGFFSMSIAPIKTISHMAIYMSLGVLFAFFLSVTLLTFFLSFIRPPKELSTNEKSSTTEKKSTRLDQLLLSCSNFTIKRPGLSFTLFILLLSIAASGLPRLNIDSNYLTDFSDEVKVKMDTQHIDNTMGGMSSFVYLLDAGEEGGIKNPAYLKELERVQAEVENHTPLIRKTTSIVDLLKDINQSFHGDDPEYYKIPTSRELIAQYLLVYEMSGGDDLYSYVTNDYSQAILQMRVQLTNSSELAKFDSRIQTYLDQNPLIVAEKSNTGIGALWLQLINYISESQVRGLTLALFVITILISMIYGSLRMGLVSMVPNIGPILIVAGWMGWIGVDLDSSKLLIATVAIGIAVDDTIHMMTRLKMEFHALGNYAEAFQRTIQEVGRALVITSVTLVCGWSALLLSIMDAQVWFAILLSSTIILALLADFFVMPVLVFWLKPFGPEFAVESKSDTSTEFKSEMSTEPQPNT